MPERLPGLRQHLEFRHLVCARIGGRPHPLLGTPVAFVERPVLRHLARPHVVREHARVGSERHAGVDERAAAEPAADEHVHVLTEPHVVERGIGPHPEALAADLELVLEVGELGRKLAGQNFASALEHGDAFSGAREPRGRDAAAVARADDDHVVAAFHVFERAAQSVHEFLPRLPSRRA